MQSVPAALREARSEVAPLVPELAPWLPMSYGTTELDVVQEELLGSIIAQGVDPATISEPDFNKLSRHTLAAGVIGLQRNYLIEGEGRDARFNEEAFDYVAARGRDKFFMMGVLSLQDVGARYVQSAYGAGRDAAHSWYPLAHRRYQELAHRGLKITPVGLSAARGFSLSRISEPLPAEGRSIAGAMHTSALGKSVNYLLRFVRRNVKGIAARTEVAHDIAPQFLGGLASLHFYELNSPRPTPRAIKGEIVRNPKTGRYRLRQTPRHRRQLYPHLPPYDLPNARLKCAAHAAVEGDDTDMMYFVHAAINLGADHYGML